MEIHEYEIMYRVEDSLWWYCALRQRIDAAFSTFAYSSPDVLDVGCGTGALMQHLADRARVTGIDYSPHALAFCHDRGLTPILQGDAASLPFASGIFHVVTACDLLYHANVPEPITVLSEMYRVLKSSGIVILNVPAYNGLYSSHDTAVHTARRFTKSQVVQMLRDVQLTPLCVGYWNSLLFPLLAGIRVFRRFVPARQSDLATMPTPWVNELLKKLLTTEQCLDKRMPMPFGLSVFAVARKA